VAERFSERFREVDDMAMWNEVYNGDTITVTVGVVFDPVPDVIQSLKDQMWQTTAIDELIYFRDPNSFDEISS